MKTRITILLLLGCFTVLSAQESPYYLTKKRILYYSGAGVGLSITGLALHNSIRTVPLSTLELGTIPSFDEFAVGNNSESAANRSDFVLYTSIAAPALLLLDNRMRSNAGKLGILYLETMMINRGVTDIFKSTVKRPRPFVRVEGLPGSMLVSNRDRASYFSGHTSATATACFFVAQVYNDYHPDNPWRYGVWTLAATLPALTGYFRIQAGKHYLSDIVSGYIVGGAIGILVPILHRKPPQEQRMTIAPGLNGVSLGWRF